jgi:ABC-type arginine transport system permease subunit
MSAVARRRGGLPGKILLKYPVLVTLMPFVRTLRAAQWLAKRNRKMFLLFLLIWPLYLVAATFWSYGFLEECLSSDSSSDVNARYH